MNKDSQVQDDAEESKNTAQLEAEQKRLKQIILDHYHCTFFLPIVQDTDNPFPAEPVKGQGLSCKYSLDEIGNSQKHQAEQSKNAQAYHFFTPHLRNIIFDTGTTNQDGKLDAIKEWSLPSSLIDEWKLTLHKTKADRDNGVGDNALNHQETVFESVKLYRYFNGNYLLAFRVLPSALNEMLKFRDNKIHSLASRPENSSLDPGRIKALANSGFPLFDESCDYQYLEDYADTPFIKKYEALQLEAWLRFSRLARQLFPSFIEQEEEGKVAQISLSKNKNGELIKCFDNQTKPSFPEHSGEQLSPILRSILLEFFPTNQHANINQWVDKSFRLYDDRMFISVAYSLSGKVHSQRTLGLINTLVAVTDRVSDVWADFDNHPYSPSALSPYLAGKQFDFWKDQAGTYVFTDVANAYVSRGWFFRDIIATTHIPYVYDRMLIQALFYQSSLRYYDHAITSETEKLIDHKKNNKKGNTTAGMTALLGEFIQFTNQYWFKEVTNQMQGKEIFKLQLNGLELDDHFNQLQDEINRTSDYLHADYEKQQTEKSNNLAVWALIIAIIALVPIINDIFSTPDHSLWTSLSCWLGTTFLGQTQEAAKAITSIGRISIAAVLTLLIVFLGWRAARKK